MVPTGRGFVSVLGFIISSRPPCGAIPTAPETPVKHTWIANKKEQTTMRHLLITFQLENFKKCWRRCGSIGPVYVRCWWDYKLFRSYWFPGDVCKCSAQHIQSGGKLVTSQMFIDRKINKYLWNKIERSNSENKRTTTLRYIWMNFTIIILWEKSQFQKGMYSRTFS